MALNKELEKMSQEEVDKYIDYIKNVVGTLPKTPFEKPEIPEGISFCDGGRESLEASITTAKIKEQK